jgi:hypothetical protein
MDRCDRDPMTRRRRGSSHSLATVRPGSYTWAFGAKAVRRNPRRAQVGKGEARGEKSRKPP